MISRSLFSPFSLCQLYLFRRNSKDSYKSNFIIRVYLAVRSSTLPKTEIQLKANSNGRKVFRRNLDGKPAKKTRPGYYNDLS